MNNDEKKEKMMFLQKFFLKSFIISIILLIISTFLCIVMHDYQIAFVNKYFPMDVEDYNYLVVLLLGMWKILIVQFTLIPTLVIWCMRHCCCQCKK